MTDNPVNLSSEGPPSTVIPAEPAAVNAGLASAMAREAEEQRAAVAEVVRAHPASMDGWAHLGALGRDDMERYACYRVGYHRGLDALRANGWRGSGYVRWADESNRGFLRCLAGLARVAEAIGEADEAARCRMFLLQLEPAGVPDDA